METSSSNKRKFSHFKKHSRGKNNNNKGQNSKEVKETKAYVTTTTNDTGRKPYTGSALKCKKCPFHHYGECRSPKCGKCGKLRHRTEVCWGTNTKDQGCFNCGDKGHFKRDCPKEIQARGRAFVIGAKDARQEPNVVTGTFPINNHFASILFDTGADYSFISKEFRNILGVESSKLDIPYSIELADGKLVESGEIIKKCTLELGERNFDIDLLPVPLGSFDVVIGMDWLSDNQAEVICHEKIIRIPLPVGEHLLVHGEKQDMPL
ncbi:uncharacterized protein LOC110944861 [Helianthus annuus]|uniref:uncharacterized protein LOC110944861 n=1 Tax=Helianthus annuus TaxID=4232 RepID=UPI000B8FC592|nr:uncharacterized protein LOC110944861 [Helianthus annuus]